MVEKWSLENFVLLSYRFRRCTWWWWWGNKGCKGRRRWWIWWFWTSFEWRWWRWWSGWFWWWRRGVKNRWFSSGPIWKGGYLVVSRNLDYFCFRNLCDSLSNMTVCMWALGYKNLEYFLFRIRCTFYLIWLFSFGL